MAPASGLPGARNYDGRKATVINREKCVVCGTCVEVCPYDAYELLGNAGYAGGAMRKARA